MLECVLRFVNVHTASPVSREWKRAAAEAKRWRTRDDMDRARDRSRNQLLAYMAQMKLSSSHMAGKGAERLSDFVWGFPVRSSEFTGDEHSRGFIGIQPMLDDLDFVSLVLRGLRAKASDYNDAPDEVALEEIASHCDMILYTWVTEGTDAQMAVLVQRGAVEVLVQLLKTIALDDYYHTHWYQDCLAAIVRRSPEAHRRVKDQHVWVVERATQQLACTNADVVQSSVHLIAAAAAAAALDGEACCGGSGRSA